MDYEQIKNHKSIVKYALKDRLQQILKRIKAIRKTKAYLKFKDTGINKSFDIIGTDFKSLIFELKNLDYEYNIIQDILEQNRFKLLLSFEIKYIKSKEAV